MIIGASEKRILERAAKGEAEIGPGFVMVTFNSDIGRVPVIVKGT